MHSHFSKPLSFFTTVEDDVAIVKAMTPKIASYDDVIVGAGIAGLTAAIELSKKGKNVLVIEKRSKKHFALRPQLVLAREDIIEHASSFDQKNMSDEDIYFVEYMTPHIGIKDYQRFLLERINHQSCTIAFESKVTEINVKEGTLLLTHLDNPTQQEKISFKKIAITDGGKHETANLLEPYITYRPVQDRPEKYHVMAYLTVTPKNSEFMRVPDWEDTTIRAIKHRDHYGVIYHNSALDEDVKKMKFSVVMHITEELAKKFETDRLAGVAYLKECLETAFNKDEYSISMPKSKKWGPEKDKLKYSVFCLNFTEATSAAFEMSERLFALGGDAFRTADFYQAQGANDAVFYGLQIALLFNGYITLDAFNNVCRARSEQMSVITRDMKLREGLESVTVGKLKQASFEKATPMGETQPGNHGTKTHSGNLRMFSFEPDGYVATPNDEIYSNNVPLRK